MQGPAEVPAVAAELLVLGILSSIFRDCKLMGTLSVSPLAYVGARDAGEEGIALR